MGLPYGNSRSILSRLIGHRPSRIPPLRILVVAVVLIVISLTLFDGRFTATNFWPTSTSPNRPGIGRISLSETPNQLKSPDVVAFWKDFVDTLIKAKPNAAPIRPNVAASMDDLQMDEKKAKETERLNVTTISENDFRAMKDSHECMKVGAKVLAPRLPYVPNSRGIVMTAGGWYFGVAITSVRMLRRTGSTLPVEVFLDTWADYDIKTCEEILPSLNAKCLVLSDIFGTTSNFGSLFSYQYKVFALLFSSFEQVLFLDADAFPAHNPDTVLDLEPYTSTGLVTYPDFWVSTTSSLFYAIAAVPIPPLSLRRSSESGVMLYSKRIHSQALLLAAYYNYYGPNFYYPLLSQGALGEGDKETFLHAALALGEPFYDVRTPVTVMGSFINGTWYSAGMKQGDPVEDLALQKTRRKSVAEKAKVEGGGWISKEKHGEEEKGEEEKEEFAKALFIHNNIVKLDVKHLFDHPERWRNETGHPIRLWGDMDNVVHEFGYDMEHVLWEELVVAACQIEPEQCKKALSHVGALFPEERWEVDELLGKKTKELH